MLQYIPAEITFASFSGLVMLGGYIWNSQNKQINDIKKTQKARPCNSIHLEIIEMKTDIKWIKEKINELKK